MRTGKRRGKDRAGAQQPSSTAMNDRSISSERRTTILEPHNLEGLHQSERNQGIAYVGVGAILKIRQGRLSKVVVEKVRRKKSSKKRRRENSLVWVMGPLTYLGLVCIDYALSPFGKIIPLSLLIRVWAKSDDFILGIPLSRRGSLQHPVSRSPCLVAALASGPLPTALKQHNPLPLMALTYAPRTRRLSRLSSPSSSPYSTPSP